MTPRRKENRFSPPPGRFLPTSAKTTRRPSASKTSADTAKIFAATNFNGDGIIPADAASDDATKAVIADIMACLGIENDRSGKPGIGQAKADLFFAEAQAHSDWWKQAEGDKNILPLGEATAAASAAVKAVKVKVDDFFARCRLAAFDARAIAALNRPGIRISRAGDKRFDRQRRRNRQLSRSRKSPPEKPCRSLTA